MPARCPTAWEDEYTLLCERCGYVLEDLATTGECPECGKSIGESLPERRVGTPWQQDPSFRSLMATWWVTARHPLRTLNTLRIEDRSSRRLSNLSNLIAGFSLIPSAVLLFGFDTLPTSLVWTLGVMTGLGMFGLFETLSSIEQTGIRFLGARRGFRVSPSLARTVCAHGSIGWLVTAAGINLAIVPAIGLDVPGHGFQAHWLGWTFFGGWSLAALGFVSFESFAWLGLRRCRYANRVRPAELDGRTGS